jgi:post-segregation antitoxin (ccd killing protein)
MQIAITVPDELAAQARELGISLETYVQTLIAQARLKSADQQLRTAEQIEGFFTAMAEGSDRLPLLRTGAFTRESFYNDRH